MKTIENEGTTTLEAQAAPNTETQEQKAPTKAKGAKQARRVAPAKAKSAKKTTPAKKPAKAPKKAAKAKADGPREGSKSAQVIAMLQRKGGATLDQICKATGWQRHTTRGFISILGTKHGLKIESTRREDGARLYAAAVGGTK